MNKQTYILEVDGFVMGSIPGEHIGDLLQTDTHGFTVHKCNDSLINQFLESINEPFYEFKWFFDAKDAHNQPHIVKITEPKQKRIFDFKQFWYDEEDNALVYISNEMEVERFLGVIKEFTSPDYDESVSVDDFCAMHSERIYADKINVPDHFPERTKMQAEKSEAMMKSLEGMFGKIK